MHSCPTNDFLGSLLVLLYSDRLSYGGFSPGNLVSSAMPWSFQAPFVVVAGHSDRRQVWGAQAPAGSHRGRMERQALRLTAFPCFQSMKWSDEGIFLLASQPVDKCQSQDGAEAALQEIEKFLETGAENKIQELNKIYKEYECILNQDLLVMPVWVLSLAWELGTHFTGYFKERVF